MPDTGLLLEPTLDAIPAEPEIFDERAGKYLLVRLDHTEFALRVARVREVMNMQQVTSVHNSHPLIPGVINLRGKVIPVLDLRLKFDLPAASPAPSTCIIIIRTAVAFIQVTMGVIVDEVLDIFAVRPGEISDAPGIYSSPHILGFTWLQGRKIVLLDIEEVLNNLDVLRLGPSTAV